MSKEVQESNLQQQLQEVEQRRHDFMPEHQIVQNISQRYKTCMIKEELCAMRSDFGSCRTKLISTKWSIRGCSRIRKKERQCFASGGLLHGDDGGTVLRQRSRSCRGLSSMPCARCSSRNSRPFPFLRRCQEKEEEEGIVRTNKTRQSQSAVRAGDQYIEAVSNVCDWTAWRRIRRGTRS